jgi:ABC-2 type transport system ATP-binding protein
VAYGAHGGRPAPQHPRRLQRGPRAARRAAAGRRGDLRPGTTVASVAPDTTRRVGTVAIPAGVGGPVAYQVASGPIRLAGSAYFTGDLTALGVETRGFYGLGIGTSPADAELVQNNVYPLSEDAPVDGERRRVELPAVAVDVPEGQNLYLIATPVSDTFAGMGSRTPGAIVFDNTAVHLPVVGR